jgi:succinate dehydrogenase/fumarate reductase cytochrome b subunit
MLVFHVAAGLYALFMLARHASQARRGRVESILVCVVSLAVLVMAARALALAAGHG